MVPIIMGIFVLCGVSRRTWRGAGLPGAKSRSNSPHLLYNRCQQHMVQ